MSFLLHQSRFFTTVNHLRDLPATAQPEIAFAGRSNAGKSTAINILCNQKRLAFASKTPGRTQHINYFSVGKADEPAAHLVDLPGYGYAKVALTLRQQWGELIAAYLERRLSLRALVLLMDVRHPLTALDVQLLELWLMTGKPCHVLLTKADKLSRGAGLQVLMRARKAVDEELVSWQLFSATTGVGLEEARVRIMELLQEP
jgi:GTP-binding protein